MKIRTGFVSNSSSSSFVIFGKSIMSQEAKLADVRAGKIYIRGKCLGDGTDFFELTTEMLKFALKNDKIRDLDWYYVHAKIESDGDMVNIPAGAEGYKVMTLEVDQHSTNDVEELKERYLDDTND